MLAPNTATSAFQHQVLELSSYYGLEPVFYEKYNSVLRTIISIYNFFDKNMGYHILINVTAPRATRLIYKYYLKVYTFAPLYKKYAKFQLFGRLHLVLAVFS